MKKFIFRKPKFMRSDELMMTYTRIADVSIKNLSAARSDEDKDFILETVDRCISKAAKAGGFFNTKDFIKWINLHPQTLKD